LLPFWPGTLKRGAHGFTFVLPRDDGLATKHILKRSQLTTRKRGGLRTRTISVALLKFYLIGQVFSSNIWVDIFEDQIRNKKYSRCHVFATSPINSHTTHCWPRAPATVLCFVEQGSAAAKSKINMFLSYVLSPSQKSGGDLALYQQTNKSINLTVAVIGVLQFTVFSMRDGGLITDAHGFAIVVTRRFKSTNIDNTHQFVQQESRSHFLGNEGG
jgi:hypothetical protein